MTYISPWANALAQGLATQQEMSAEKVRQGRPKPVAPRGAAPQADQFEHQVESPEEPAAIHEEARQRRERRGRRQRHFQGASTEERAALAHIDLKA